MVFIINGYPGSGKDTFVEMVRKNYKELNPTSQIVNISTIDYLKDLFKEKFEWNGQKTPEVRMALAVIHGALTHWNDIPFVLTSKKIKEENDKGNIVFVHCREPENIFKYSCSFQAPAIFINNLEVEYIVKHCPDQYSEADKDVKNYDYNVIIDNNGTFDDLENNAKQFIYDYIIGY